MPAAPAQAQPVTVKDAWVRAPAPGQKIAAAYLELVSRTNTALVAAASPLALTVQRADSSRVVFTVQAEVRAAGAGQGHHQHSLNCVRGSWRSGRKAI